MCLSLCNLAEQHADRVSKAHSESGTDHVEKATFVTSGSLFLENFGRIKLSFGTGMKKYLVDRMPVFWR